jgi:hypothetical protein
MSLDWQKHSNKEYGIAKNANSMRCPRPLLLSVAPKWQTPKISTRHKKTDREESVLEKEAEITSQLQQRVL